MKWVVVVVAACGTPSTPTPTPTAAPPTPAKLSCEAVEFAASTPIPEASGAAWMTIDGKELLVTMGDSDRDGAYGLIDPESGATVETGKLPLGDAGDDLEGLATRGGLLYAVTSAGWMRSWKRVDHGFALVDGPYPIGPVDLPDQGHGHGTKPPDGDGMVCGARGSNCGRNYEGLCLAPGEVKPECVGFVASKADGHLYCLADDHGKLLVRRDHPIEIARPGSLADCAFAPDGGLWAGGNLFDGNQVYRVDGWRDPVTAHVEAIGLYGVGNCEGIAVRGDTIWRFSDLNNAPSLMSKFRCTANAR